MTDYSRLTNEQFDILLADIMDTTFITPSALLQIPGIYEIVSEELNNAVLSAWEELTVGEQQKDEDE